jgi:hypothetical protein
MRRVRSAWAPCTHGSPHPHTTGPDSATLGYPTTRNVPSNPRRGAGSGVAAPLAAPAMNTTQRRDIHCGTT